MTLREQKELLVNQQKQLKLIKHLNEKVETLHNNIIVLQDVAKYQGLQILELKNKI